MKDKKISKKILISIPTYNEVGNVEQLIQQLHEAVPQADLLFIDDNSPDGTGELLDKLARKNKHMAVIHRPIKSGLGAAHKLGFSYARKHKYQTLVTMDADLLHDPRYIPCMIQDADKADIVIGSRYIAGGAYNGIGTTRKKLTYFWRWVIQKAVGLEHDATSSFRLYRVKILRPEIYEKISAIGFEFNMEALYHFKRAGARVVEIPIEAQGRKHGASKLTSKDMFAVLRKFLYLSWDRLRYRSIHP